MVKAASEHAAFLVEPDGGQLAAAAVLGGELPPVCADGFGFLLERGIGVS